MISRRHFTLSGLSALVFQPLTTASTTRKIPVALQLFSVRKQCETDLSATLSQVAEIGFTGVEFAGYYGHQAEELRRLLDERRLTCCGAHVPLGALLGDRLQETIAFHEILGNKSLILPGVPHQFTRDEASWREAAGILKGISDRLNGRMRVGYHNHAAEFKGRPGNRPWDILFENTPPEVLIELDLGGAGYGGADPVAVLTEFPGRVRLVHVKDYTPTKPDVPIGDGAMDWKRFFPACANTAGVEWFIIEHDSDPSAHLADIADCLHRFKERE